MKVAILGWGQYGQALGSLLQQNNKSFTPVTQDVPLNDSVDIIFLTVPTQAIQAALQANVRFLNSETIIVNGSKGIEKDTCRLPYQIAQDMGYNNYYNLIGPSFASEVLNKDATLVSLGYTTSRHVDTIKSLLQAAYFRLQQTPNYEALELAAALKNVYAILCGYANGLNLSANTQAQLITLALQEIVKLSEAMNLTIKVTDVGVTGDLILTCTSQKSRNYQFGHNLLSMDAKQALEKVNSTVEGFYTSKSVQLLAKKYHVDLPLAALTEKIINNKGDARELFYNYLKSI